VKQDVYECASCLGSEVPSFYDGYNAKPSKEDLLKQSCYSLTDQITDFVKGVV